MIANSEKVFAPKSARATIIFIAFLCAYVGWVALMAAQVDEKLYHSLNAENYWFQADLERVLSSETDLLGSHYRNQVHPFFSISIYPLVSVARFAGYAPRPAALIVQLAATGALLWCFRLLLQRVGCREIDSLLGTIFLASCSATIFWSVVLETYIWGALSIVVALLLTDLSLRRPEHKQRLNFFAGLVAMSMTITNWVVALLPLIRLRPWSLVLRIVFLTLTVAFAISLVQSVIFSGSVPFFIPSKEEQSYMAWPSLSAALPRLLSLVVFPVNAPLPLTIDAQAPNWPRLSMLFSIDAAFFSRQPLQLGVWVAWLGLLASGFAYFIRKHTSSLLQWSSAGFVAFQLAMHLLYGDEPFLYSARLVPGLALLAVAPLATIKAREVRYSIRGLLFFLCIINFYANSSSVAASISDIGRHLSERERSECVYQSQLPVDWPTG